MSQFMALLHCRCPGAHTSPAQTSVKLKLYVPTRGQLRRLYGLGPKEEICERNATMKAADLGECINKNTELCTPLISAILGDLYPSG